MAPIEVDDLLAFSPPAPAAAIGGRLRVTGGGAGAEQHGS
jgi:hypothetical protein